jgi:predicted Zn-dependent protease
METAIKFDPDNRTPLADLGVIHEIFGDPNAAVHDIAGWLQNDRHRATSGYAELALLAEATGDKAGADAALKEATAISGGAGMAAIVRAQITFMRGDRKGAEDAMRELIRREPDNAAALAVLSMTLSAGGHFHEALETYHRAASTVPPMPIIHYLLAVRLHQLGHDSEAHRECEIAFATTPRDPSIRALMVAINRAESVKR